MRNLRLLFIFITLFVVACSSDSTSKTDAELYEKNIFSEQANQTKIQEGDKVTLYYCLKNGEEVLASSDQTLEPTIITIPPKDSLSKFERPLMWLGLGDSCVVKIDANEAAVELLSFQEKFKKGDKATFIYKVLKIE